jgi:hypothetical protein
MPVPIVQGKGYGLFYFSSFCRLPYAQAQDRHLYTIG